MAHTHSHGSATQAFGWAIVVNLAYTALEAGYGFHTNSLALLSDALHNLGDVLGLGLAWAAAKLAQRPPTQSHTYGWRRATLLSPLANSILLMVFSGALGWEAIRRFSAPPSIPALPVMVVAGIGIFVNLGAAWLLRDGHGHDLNKRGALGPDGNAMTRIAIADDTTEGTQSQDGNLRCETDHAEQSGRFR